MNKKIIKLNIRNSWVDDYKHMQQIINLRLHQMKKITIKRGNVLDLSEYADETYDFTLF